MPRRTNAGNHSRASSRSIACVGLVAVVLRAGSASRSGTARPGRRRAAGRRRCATGRRPCSAASRSARGACQPISSHTSSGSGSVSTISDQIGMSDRCRRRSRVRYASPARTMTSAVTSPASVRSVGRRPETPPGWKSVTSVSRRSSRPCARPSVRARAPASPGGWPPRRA